MQLWLVSQTLISVEYMTRSAVRKHSKKESKGMGAPSKGVEATAAKILCRLRTSSIIFSTDRKFHVATIALDKDNRDANHSIKKKRSIRGPC